MSARACPCCGLPTLTEPTGDTCPLCLWEDADGANAPYTLAEAQENYRARGHMFRADDPLAPREGPMRARLRAIAGATPFDAVAYRAWLVDWQDWSC